MTSKKSLEQSIEEVERIARLRDPATASRSLDDMAPLAWTDSGLIERAIELYAQAGRFPEAMKLHDRYVALTGHEPEALTSEDLDRLRSRREADNLNAETSRVVVRQQPLRDWKYGVALPGIRGRWRMVSVDSDGLVLRGLLRRVSIPWENIEKAALNERKLWAYPYGDYQPVLRLKRMLVLHARGGGITVHVDLSRESQYENPDLILDAISSYVTVAISGEPPDETPLRFWLRQLLVLVCGTGTIAALYGVVRWVA